MDHPEPVIGGAVTCAETPAEISSARPLAAIEAAVQPEPVAIVPAGAPPRLSARPGTPFEKIRAGLSRL
ncbi:MAG: hypothetical protein R3B97_07825 [Dehalococcoidia bacterium]|nr:hypothetical protein [Dehalococcoidia bacterium]